MRVTHGALATMLCLGPFGCDLGDRLEGCGSEADAMRAAGLEPSDGASFAVADISLPLPRGYLYRVRDGVLELYAAPGIYCDSGDWGLVLGGSVRLQRHEEVAPTDPFLHFPDAHRGHTRRQIELGIGPFRYSFAGNAHAWHVNAYFGDAYRPHVIFMYVTTELSFDDETRGLAIHYFPAPSEHVLSVLVAAIDAAAAERSRAER